MTDFPTTSKTFQGSGIACALATALIDRSWYFEVMPRPNDEYRFTVREENGATLARLHEWAKELGRP